MKKVLLLAMFVTFMCGNAFASVIAYEGFVYDNNSVLWDETSGLSGGSGWDGEWYKSDASAVAATIVDASLSYTDSKGAILVTGGGKFLSQVDQARGMRDFTATSATQGQLWMSGLLSMNDAEGTPPSSNDLVGLTLFGDDGSGGVEQKVWLSYRQNKIQFLTGNVGSIRILTEEPYAQNQIAFLVACLDSSTDMAYAWLNPDLDEANLNPFDADTNPNGYFAAHEITSDLVNFSVNTLRASGNALADEDYIDEIRLGTTYADVSSSSAASVPADGATVDRETLQLEWSPMDGTEPASYTLHYRANDPNWTDTAATTTISNATSPHTPSPILEFDTTYYWRVDADGLYEGPTWSFTTLPSEPTIIVQPKDATVEAGSDAVFTATAVNYTSIEWYKEGSATILGTEDTFTITGVTQADEGVYYCKLSGNGLAESTGAQLMTERLVSRWEFEDDTLDSEGVNDGTFMEAAYSDGVVAGTKAAQFDGADPNGVVSVPFAAELNTQSFTVSAWAKVEGGAGNYRGTLSNRDGDPTAGYILYANNANDWQGWIGSGSGWSKLGNIGVTANEWTHVAMTFDTTSISDDNAVFTGNARFYVNGLMQSEGQSTFRKNPEQQMLIGGGVNEAVEASLLFNGLIDDVRYYSYAMDKVAVAVLYTNVTSEVVCTENPELDFTGPDGIPDCRVDLYEFAAIAAQWLECNEVPTCKN